MQSINRREDKYILKLRGCCCPRHIFCVSFTRLTSPRAHRDHHPDSTHVLRVLNDFDAEGVAALVSTRCQYFLAYGTAVDVSDDTIAVAMCELDGERLESMTLGHIVLDTVLELHSCEVTSADPLKFVVSQRS